MVVFASRSLTPVEQRYSQTEREALAIVWAAEKVRDSLLSSHFSGFRVKPTFANF